MYITTYIYIYIYIKHNSQLFFSCRFAQLQQPNAAPTEVIDKEAYLSAKTQPNEQKDIGQDTPWSPTQLRVVPAFYPLEKSSRLVEDESAEAVAARLVECLRLLSVQAWYDSQAATAHLLTAEHVEMHLSLWQPPLPQQGVVAELQRRKGDSIVFHRYSRSILDAAMGEVELETLPTLDDKMYSKKVQRMLKMEYQEDKEEHENAIIAMEIAHGLLMKDRMDARQLGLESLCLLTDPLKTGHLTSVLCSHVVLLGNLQGVAIVGEEDPSSFILMDTTPFEEIRSTVLSLVQFSRIGEEEDETEEDDETSQMMMLLHNLALAVLANALDVIEHPERFQPDPEEHRSRLRTASSNDVANEFMQQEASRKEIITTLISELGAAHTTPHNATLSAKCLGSLLRASDEASRRAQELGAKQVVSTALEVGARTHYKLETECQKVVRLLNGEETPPRDD